MQTNPVYIKHAKLLRINKAGYPTVVRPEYEQLWAPFTKSQVAREIFTLYGHDTKMFLAARAIAFVSFLETQTSSPLNPLHKYSTLNFTRELLKQLHRAWPKIFSLRFKKMRLTEFEYGDTHIKMDPRFNKFLNMSVFPSVSLYKIMTVRGKLDATLAKLNGYMYTTFPDALKTPVVTVSPSNVRNIPLYQWHPMFTEMGIRVYIKRLSKEILALRVDFDVPHMLPVGDSNIRVFSKYLERNISTFKFF